MKNIADMVSVLRFFTLNALFFTSVELSHHEKITLLKSATCFEPMLIAGV
jgi:hypothetical protein